VAALIDGIHAELRATFAGRPVVVAGGVLAGMTGPVDELRRVDAGPMLLIAAGLGTGPVPEGDDVDVVLYDLPPTSTTTELFRAEERFFANPPAALVDRVRAFAGDEPLVLAQPFLAVQSFGPFPVYGGRRREWVALEDKTRLSDIFGAAGVPELPNLTVDAQADALVAAARALDVGEGTVWAGDARDGFNGGAEYVRWVRDDASRNAALAFFTERCDRVRVSPFLEGVPCSIHGFVTPDGVAVFRPVEMVVLRTDDTRGFLSAGAATYFDPDDCARDTMRAAAARLGECLRERVGFRAAFTIDGICTADGWVATECNPRAGAGVGYLGACVPEWAGGLTHRLVVEGGGVSARAAELEQLVIERADAQRWGGAWTVLSTTFDENSVTPLCSDGSGYRVATTAEEADARLTVGPGFKGGFVRFQPKPERTPAGPSLAPRAVAAFACADALFDTALGSTRAAHDFTQRN
jgi:hypothetical protein